MDLCPGCEEREGKEPDGLCDLCSGRCFLVEGKLVPKSKADEATLKAVRISEDLSKDPYISEFLKRQEAYQTRIRPEDFTLPKDGVKYCGEKMTLAEVGKRIDAFADECAFVLGFLTTYATCQMWKDRLVRVRDYLRGVAGFLKVCQKIR